MPEDVQSINSILKRLNSVLLSETFYRDNLLIAKSLEMRSEGGFLSTMSDFLQYASANIYI
jgi:hypothetical protein